MFIVKPRENLTQGFEIIFKIDQYKSFLLFFKDIFENFPKNSPNNCIFRPKRENVTRGFLNLFEKSPKIIHILQFFEEIFGNFQNFLASGELRPPDPLRGRPTKMSPPPEL